MHSIVHIEPCVEEGGFKMPLMAALKRLLPYRYLGKKKKSQLGPCSYPGVVT